MLLCQHNPDFDISKSHQQEYDWSLPATTYSNMYEFPSFVAQQQKKFTVQSGTNNANPNNLQGNQMQSYLAVQQHFQSKNKNNVPLRMIISGTAGTGKSYLIQCLKSLLKDSLRVAAPTGVAAYNISGWTLHSLLNLPVKGEFKSLEGKRLQTMQEDFKNVQYIIIDEMSMIGRKTFGMVDKRLRQAFPNKATTFLGGCSCLLIGDWGQLPPVMDLPLYTVTSKNELSNLGSISYHLFDRSFVLHKVMRQAGKNPDQEIFRDLLTRLRNAELTISDWELLMTRTPAKVGDTTCFSSALYLYPTVEAVTEHNIRKLNDSNHPVAMIKAVHTGPGASKASSDDAGGLEAVVCIAHGARVMLTANLWTEVGLVNGTLGTVTAICYESGQGPPSLPIAVTIKFDSYSGPTLEDGAVPIIPLRRTWFSTTNSCSRLQVPLKLAWAITIHKSQGLTLEKVVIDVGKKEFSSGLTFVACSRVRHLKDILFISPFTYQRIANIGKGNRLKERRDEDSRLERMCADQPKPTLKDIPINCLFLEAESNHLAVSDIYIEPASEEPYVSITNISEGNRLKERRDEDSRLERMCADQTKPTVKDIPINCLFLEAESNHLAVSDIYIEPANEEPYVCPFKYYPVDDNWQRMTCENLELTYVCSN